LQAFAIKYIIVRNIHFTIFDWESDFKKASPTNCQSHPQAYVEKKKRFETLRTVLPSSFFFE